MFNSNWDHYQENNFLNLKDSYRFFRDIINKQETFEK